MFVINLIWLIIIQFLRFYSLFDQRAMRFTFVKGIARPSSYFSFLDKTTQHYRWVKYSRAINF